MLKRIILCLSLLASSMASGHQLAVLCYHHVDFPRAKSYNISRELLTAHLQALKTAGFVFVSMEDVRQYYRGKADLPSRSALVTFDDGTISTYKLAWPILKKMNIPLTVFVYPTAISVGHKLGFMDWSEVRALSKAGVEIGAHGFDHPYLPFPPKSVQSKPQFDNWLIHETKGAKDYIESKISVSVTALALPFGLEDVASYYAVKRAGYQLAFNISGMTNDGKGDPMYLNRIMVVDGDSPKSVVQKAQTRPLILSNRFPFSLSRIFLPSANIHFRLSKEADIVTSSMRVAFSSKGFCPPGYDNARGYTKTVSLPKDQIYSVLVFARNQRQESLFATWSFVKHKSPPTYWQ